MNTFEQRLAIETDEQAVDQCDSAELLYSRGLIGHSVLLLTYDTFVRSTPIKKHYIAMAGLHECLPNYCASHDSFESAVEGLSQLHDLGRKRMALLRKDGYLELRLHRDGNEYCEIVECDCDDPSVHNDD